MLSTILENILKVLTLVFLLVLAGFTSFGILFFGEWAENGPAMVILPVIHFVVGFSIGLLFPEKWGLSFTGASTVILFSLASLGSPNLWTNLFWGCAIIPSVCLYGGYVGSRMRKRHRDSRKQTEDSQPS